MKNLLICPVCFAHGKKEVLGELDEQGNLVIMRYRQGSTVVTSSNMVVRCGVCKEEVFYRRKNALRS